MSPFPMQNKQNDRVFSRCSNEWFPASISEIQKEEASKDIYVFPVILSLRRFMWAARSLHAGAE
jgi:hypothetical protein